MIDEQAREFVRLFIDDVIVGTDYDLESVGYSLIFWGCSIGISQGFSREECLQTITNCFDEWQALSKFRPTVH